MLTQEIIIKRRDGQPLTPDEIKQFVTGIADGSVSDAQIAALCMTAFMHPMDVPERTALTLSMARSGMVLDWTDQTLNGPILDKHSTGGIGDKVSLMLAPIIAACGGYVPMISGRGLGHTGGTLDKMDAIRGYASQPDLDTLRRVVRDTGCAIIGATSDLAPADKRMYAVRDISGTVESLDLITASILSKKMAAGLSGLVMDVKFGSGAFMADYDDARALAQSIVGVANGGGLPCVALLSDMNQVLGHSAGNAIEVLEAIAFLRNEEIEQRLYDVTMDLCAELLVLGGLAADAAQARTKCAHALNSGMAAEIFARMVAALGGPSDLIENAAHYLKTAPLAHPVHAERDGFITAIDARKIGYAVIELGGGRRVATDAIDYGVGLDHMAGIGAQVGPGMTPICTLYARDSDSRAGAEKLIRAAVTIGDTPAPHTYPVRERIFSTS